MQIINNYHNNNINSNNNNTLKACPRQKKQKKKFSVSSAFFFLFFYPHFSVGLAAKPTTTTTRGGTIVIYVDMPWVVSQSYLLIETFPSATSWPCSIKIKRGGKTHTTSGKSNREYPKPAKEVGRVVPGRYYFQLAERSVTRHRGNKGFV